jgi:hypothetical protein
LIIPRQFDLIINTRSRKRAQTTPINPLLEPVWRMRNKAEKMQTNDITLINPLEKRLMPIRIGTIIAR